MRTYPVDHVNQRRLRYGWRLSSSGHIVVDPDQRNCIYRMLRMRRNACTLQQICNALAAAKYPPPRCGEWYCATVRKIIAQNETLGALLARLDARAAMRDSITGAAHERVVQMPRADAHAKLSARMHQARLEVEDA